MVSGDNVVVKSDCWGGKSVSVDVNPVDVSSVDVTSVSDSGVVVNVAGVDSLEDSEIE